MVTGDDSMNVCDIINKTKRKYELNKEEMNWLVNNFTSGNIPDYQFSAWLMAVCLNSLTENEILRMTESMKNSGKILDLSDIDGITVDKHSTGGVGDKTSLVIGPVAAACGVYVPKMSGRGLGHTGGTIDKLESIPGYKTNLPFDEFKRIVNKTGFSIISQNTELCPADKKMYALRNATETVDSIPLICASIMSKKLAVNADCILLDVKYGSGAFMKTYEAAAELSLIMEKIGINSGKKCKAVMSDMNYPLGRNIGNSLEVIEAVDVLKNKVRGHLYDVCIELAANMLVLAGKGNLADCVASAELAISSGKALEIFSETVALQGGNPLIIDDYGLLPKAKYSHRVMSSFEGKIESVNCEEIGMVSLLLGAGRVKKDSDVDLSAGIVFNVEINDFVCKGDCLMTLYSSTVSDFSEIEKRAVDALTFS